MQARETRAKSGSKKRKAEDSITSSPTISNSSRLKKTKLTEDSDDDIVVRDSVHINIKLSKQFDKISLDSPQTNLKPKGKDKTTSQPESARKTRGSAKEKEKMSEVDESEEEESDISVISDTTRRAKSARKPKAKTLYPSELKSNSTVSVIKVT